MPSPSNKRTNSDVFSTKQCLTSGSYALQRAVHKLLIMPTDNATEEVTCKDDRGFLKLCNLMVIEKA